MRLYVKLSDNMGEKLDKYATEFGQTKSGFIGFAVASFIRQLEKQDGIYQQASDIIQQAGAQTQNNISNSERSGFYDEEYLQ